MNYKGKKGLNFSEKAKKNVELLLNLLEKWLTCKLRRSWMIFKVVSFCLTLSVLQKLKNYVFEIPIIPQTLSIINREKQVQNLSTWISSESLSNTIWKTLVWSQCLLLKFSRYCCSNARWYYHPPSGLEETKGLNFQWKSKRKYYSFCWNCLKSDWITSIRGFKWYLIFFVSFNAFSTGKIQKLGFGIPIIPQNSNIDK